MSNLTIENIQHIINKSHNPSLVIPDESPNANTIYHIYSDGEITNQKGGFAYLERREFTNQIPIPNGNSLKLIFPYKGYTHTYAIVTLEDALNIRNMMQEFLNK